MKLNLCLAIALVILNRHSLGAMDLQATYVPAPSIWHNSFNPDNNWTLHPRLPEAIYQQQAMLFLSKRDLNSLIRCTPATIAELSAISKSEERKLRIITINKNELKTYLYERIENADKIIAGQDQIDDLKMLSAAWIRSTCFQMLASPAVRMWIDFASMVEAHRDAGMRLVTSCRLAENSILLEDFEHTWIQHLLPTTIDKYLEQLFRYYTPVARVKAHAQESKKFAQTIINLINAH